jgi:SAM-dependent methyltransferase
MSGAFDDLTDLYEAIIDWPKRLANEGPFFEDLFSEAGVRRVLDAACGTGHHAALFHSWGLEVEAADISPRMLAAAQGQFGGPQGLRWVERSFDAPPGGEPFDAAVCIGNSLALADGLEAAARAVENLLAAVRPGGVVDVQVLNLWRLDDGPCVWLKCVPARWRERDVLILKGVHRGGSRGAVDLVVADPRGGLLHSDSVPMLGLEAAQLERWARAAGAERIRLAGNYRQAAYDRATSVDLIMVCWK